MQIQDTFKAHGKMSLVLQRADGTVESLTKDNLIVDVGFDFICDAIGKAAGRPGAMSHIAVGTNSTVSTVSQTALKAELTRVAATYDHVAGTKVMTFTASFGAGVATGAITEAGVLNASAAGIMLDRVVFPVVNKGADDTLTAVFTFTLS